MRFERMGLVFDYPDDWALELDADGGSEAGGSPAVTLLSPRRSRPSGSSSS
jgi:hypothetical protein